MFKSQFVSVLLISIAVHADSTPKSLKTAIHSSKATENKQLVAGKNEKRSNNENSANGEYTEDDIAMTARMSNILYKRKDKDQKVEFVDELTDEENARLDLLLENAAQNDNPEEGNYREGDMLLPRIGTNSVRSSLSRQSSYWPNGMVPYKLNGTFKAWEIQKLQRAFNEYATKTCIQFFPRTTEADYVAITKTHNGGCSSHVGRVGGVQSIQLGTDKCFITGRLLHELMHTLGFLHEQNRYDRDRYIKVVFKNLNPENEKNFQKFSRKVSTNHHVPYDYGSLMHYKETAFSNNGNPTIVALRKLPKGIKLGQRRKFSTYDVLKVNRRYQCDVELKRMSKKEKEEKEKS